MVAIHHTEQSTWRRSEYDQAGKKPSGSRRYDSFMVRLWQDEESDSVLRLEVEHIQAGLSMQAKQGTLDWILPAISGCLHPTTSAGNEAGVAEDERGARATD